MPADHRDHPGRCPICGYLLTADPRFASYRCVTPAHLHAAGLPELVVLASARAKLAAPPTSDERRDDDLPF